MASTELQKIDDSGLSERQVQALERLAELGAQPAPIGPDGKPQWDSNPKIRAFQMVYEGRFGGPREGAGRPKQKRAAAVIADAMREEPRVKNMIKAIDRAMKKDAGPRANLDAIKLSMEIERGERKLEIEEEEHDGNVGQTREELVETLFQLVQDPRVERAIEGSAEEIITEAEIVSGNGVESSAGPTANGDNDGNDRSNGRSGVAPNRSKDKNPLRKAALRRAADR